MKTKLMLILLILGILFISACAKTQQETPKTCHIESVPYTDYVLLKYNLFGEPIISPSLSGINYVKRVDMKVQNADTESGTFVVKFNFRTLKKGVESVPIAVSIPPGQTITFSTNYDVDIGDDVEVTYDIQVPKKSVTLYREETKCD